MFHMVTSHDTIRISWSSQNKYIIVYLWLCLLSMAEIIARHSTHSVPQMLLLLICTIMCRLSAKGRLTIRVATLFFIWPPIRKINSPLSSSTSYLSWLNHKGYVHSSLRWFQWSSRATERERNKTRKFLINLNEIS